MFLTDFRIMLGRFTRRLDSGRLPIMGNWVLHNDIKVIGTAPLEWVVWADGVLAVQVFKT